MKKISALLMLAVFLLAGTAWADRKDPDLEGRITKIEYTKGYIVVRNELKNEIGKREYRVLVKQGMVNNYKMNNKIKVWLMVDRKEAKMIEKVSS